MSPNTATITLAAQVGGPLADQAVLVPVLELRRLLASRCKGPYSPEVDEFALVLRILGELADDWDWFVEGCSRLRRSRKGRYITIDIGVPRHRWENVPARQFREYLADSVREALALCIARLKKDKTPVDDTSLMKDYSEAVKAYLS